MGGNSDDDGSNPLQQTEVSDTEPVNASDEAKERDNIRVALRSRELARIDEIFKKDPSLVGRPCYRPYGETPLHYACRLGLDDVVKHLLDRQDIEEVLNEADGCGFLPLHCAIPKGCDENILALIDRTSPIGLVSKTNAGDTVIHLASRSGRIAVLDKVCPLMPAGLIDSLNKAGYPPIHLCIENWKVVSCLLKHGASRFTDERRNTLLHAVVAPGIVNLHRGMETRRALLARGEDLGAQNDDNDTPFHLVARNLNSGPDSTGMGSTALQELLGLRKEAPHHERTNSSLVHALQKHNKAGNTMLHLIAKEIHHDATSLKQKQAKEAVKGILSLCPRLLTIEDAEKNTPLHKACLVNNWMIVEALLQAARGLGFDYQAITMAKNKEDDIPLHLAVRKGYIETVKELMVGHQFQETILMRNNQRETPMHIAANQGHPRILEQLLGVASYEQMVSADGESELRGRRNMTPLQIAAAHASEDNATSLIEQSLRWCTDRKFLNEAEPKSRWTALHFAASKGHERVVELLLLNGADSTKTDIDNLLAADIARRANHIDVADFIRQYRPRSFRLELEQGDDQAAKVDDHFLALIWPKWDKAVRQQRALEPPRMWPHMVPVHQMIFNAHDTPRHPPKDYMKMGRESFESLDARNINVAIDLAPIHQSQIRLASCGHKGWIMNEKQERGQMPEMDLMYERGLMSPIEGILGFEESKVYLYDSKVFWGKERSTRWIHLPANNVGTILVI